MDQGEIKVIDFDDCGFSWYMYDAAASLSFYEHLPQVSSLIQHWLEGYRTVSAIGKAEEEEIPTFLMLRRLLLVAWVGGAAGQGDRRGERLRAGVVYLDDVGAVFDEDAARAGTGDDLGEVEDSHAAQRGCGILPVNDSGVQRRVNV